MQFYWYTGWACGDSNQQLVFHQANCSTISETDIPFFLNCTTLGSGSCLSLGKYSLHDLKYSIPINLSFGQPKEKNSNQAIQLDDATGNTLEDSPKNKIKLNNTKKKKINPRNLLLHGPDCDLIT